MFSWDDLKHFLAFARKGSVLAAAKAQGVNQSTVQRRLAELEERIGRRSATSKVIVSPNLDRNCFLMPSASRRQCVRLSATWHPATKNYPAWFG
jgi:hypothetical protein